MSYVNLSDENNSLNQQRQQNHYDETPFLKY